MIKAFSRLVLAAGLALSNGCAHAHTGPSKAPGRYVEHIQSGGLDRFYILRVPPGYDGKKPVPVVVVLHGWTGSAELAEIYTRMAEEGDAKGFVTVFPNGLGPKGYLGWNADTLNLSGSSNVDDVAFVSAVLDHVEQEIDTDRNREYVCGHSNGAFLSNLIGAKLSNRLAAIGSVAGSIGLGGPSAPRIPEAVGPVSVILIHGKADEMVSYGPESHAFLRVVGAQQSAKWWAKEDGCTPTPKETTSANGNVITDLYAGGKKGTDVELVSIVNGRHAWPGGYHYDDKHQPALETATGVSAADLLWSFFEAHPRRAG